MGFVLEKLDSDFRKITDLLLFSDRTDLSLLDYSNLIKKNYPDHIQYLWDRFQKSANIFWPDTNSFWFNRLNILLSLNDKFLYKNIQDFIDKRMFNLVITKKELSLKHDIEYIQYLQLYKVKSSRGENLLSVKNYLAELPAYISIDKLLYIVQSFIPFVYNDMNEYTETLCRKIGQAPHNFTILLKLENLGIPLNKEFIVDLAKRMLIERTTDIQEIRSLFLIINQPALLKDLKKVYDKSYQKNLLEMIKFLDFRIIEEFHLRNIKNIIQLDSSIVDELTIIYIDKLYNRKIKHKKANADRIIRLIKTCPQVSARKIIAMLSNKNKLNDIKYIASVFPELKKLSAFI